MAKDARHGNNGYDSATVQNLVGRIENLFNEIATLREKFAEECKPIREDIKSVFDEAPARGIPKKELRKFVAARMKLEAARKVLNDLEADQRETVEMLADAFGDAADLPLFEHRIRTAEAAQTAQEAHTAQ
jgi:uncharacterized protein (UPF0335 family)